MSENIMPEEAAEKQKCFYNTNRTKSVSYKIETLKKIQRLIKENEAEILDALYKDTGKSKTEAYLSEISVINSEIKFILKEIKNFDKPKKVKNTLATITAKSMIYREPYGVVAIISAWNYPAVLSFIPLIGAIAAGNTVILKPSEYSANTSALIRKILNENFSSEYIYAVNPETSAEDFWCAKYDYVFFTGSPETGRKVMIEAAKTLTPVTLELGGKSPCIVDKTANLEIAAKRIIRGKLFNAGQTCIAPDYLLVENSVKQKLIELLQIEIDKQYPDTLNNNMYPRIINEFHFKRLVNLIKNDESVIGGEFDEKKLKIAPAVIQDVTFDDEIMKNEIFGPLLPVIGYDDIKPVIEKIKSGKKPLACYVYTEDKTFAQKIIDEIPFGGGCVNDCLMQFANTNLPFGGTGNSGFGCYHGEYSLETFSRMKSVVHNSTKIDIKYAYAPFTDKMCEILKKIF